MPFDFPQSPASGTEVVNGGARYRYDGVKWIAVGGAATYVAKAGDVMTGALTLPGNAASALQAVPLQQVTAQIAALVNAVQELTARIQQLEAT